MSSTTNYSLWAAPAMWIVSQSAHIYAAALTKDKDFKGEFDNCSPRKFGDLGASDYMADRRLSFAGEYLARVRAQEKKSPVSRGR